MMEANQAALKQLTPLINKGFEFFQNWSPAKLEANYTLIRKNLAEGKPLFLHIVGPSVREMYLRARNLNIRDFGAYGARKVTKTFTIMLALFEIALTIPGFRWAHIFPSLTTGRDTSFDIWWQIYYILPPEMRPRVFKSYNICIFPNKSTIKVFGADPDSLNNRRSGRADGLFFDEICFMDKDTFENAVNGIFIPMTSASRWRINRFATTVADDPRHPSLTTIMPRLKAENNWLTFDIYKSPFYSEEFRQEKIRECGGEHSVQYRREYLCELIANTELRVIHNFVKDKHVVECFNPKPFITGEQFIRDGGIVVDTASNGINSDLMGMLLWRYDHDRNKLCVIDEWLGKKIDLEQMYGEMDPLLERLMCVPVKREVIDCFSELAIEIRKDGRKFVSASAYKTQVEKQAMAVSTSFYLDRIEIDPRCVKLIDQIENGLWKITENKKTFSKSKEYGHLDLLSCLCYLQRICRWGQSPTTEINWSLNDFSDCEGEESIVEGKTFTERFYEHIGIQRDAA